MINHILLLASLLEAHNFSTAFLKEMQHYLCNILQGPKVNGSLSKWIKNLAGVPEEKVLLFIFYFFNGYSIQKPMEHKITITWCLKYSRGTWV